MNVLIATDHVYLRQSAHVYDTYCFDYGFFGDYLATFEKADVLCRTSRPAALPAGAFRSDGDRLEFLDVPDRRGAAWIAASRFIASRPLRRAMADADAVVVRAPGELGWLAARAAARLGKPYMVELIGDPKPALLSARRSLGYRVAADLWE